MRRRTLLGAIGSAALLPDAVRATPVNPGVIELRQYTLFGGRRDELIAVFEREFIESQAAVGAPVLGTFRDLDDPDRFVWLRGFADMATRKAALQNFYTGPVWKAHRDEANPTMLDSGNVLLLRPASGPWSAPGGGGLYTATIHDLGGANPTDFAWFFETTIRPRLVRHGVQPFGTCITETLSNDFPALPVRDDSVFVWFARWRDAGEEARFATAWASENGWRDKAGEALLPALMRKPEKLRLAPTARSPLR